MNETKAGIEGMVSLANRIVGEDRFVFTVDDRGRCDLKYSNKKSSGEERRSMGGSLSDPDLPGSIAGWLSHILRRLMADEAGKPASPAVTESETAEVKKIISGLIEKELREGKIDNAHGINAENLREHLVEPVKQSYENEYWSDGTAIRIDLWTVLEECPEKKNGYRVFFDPKNQQFGLAETDHRGRPVYLFHTGTFLQALQAM